MAVHPIEVLIVYLRVEIWEVAQAFDLAGITNTESNSTRSIAAHPFKKH
jgi:hypothetical protein